MSAEKQDYHAVLGLTSDTSDDAIRAAYKKLALQWHPDRHLVGKERAAQMFIQVNKAYHALMDGKESAHSSSAETSSTASASASSADTARSDTPTKSTRASSRPTSASSNSSRRSSPQSPKSSSAPCEDHNKDKRKQSRAPPTRSSSPHASSSCERPGSHPQSAKSNNDRKRSSSDRTKGGQKSSKSHDHLRDPPPSATPETTIPASTYHRSSEGLSDTVRSKTSEKKPKSSSASTESKHDSRTYRNGSSRSRISQPVVPPPSGRNKSSTSGFAGEFIHKLSKGTGRGKKESQHIWSHDQEAIPYDSPLRAINAPRGASKEWIFPLPLTLDEMYHGTTYRFLVTRELLSHRTEQVEISIVVPPGMRSGTRIVCPRTGHQCKDGTLQDVVFLVEEVSDERFSRVKDDLFVDVRIPWADPLADEGGEICIQGIDGRDISFTLPYPIYDKATEGQVLVKGAGMPIRDGRETIGRGDMIVRWRVVFTAHHSKWQTLKKALHLDV